MDRKNHSPSDFKSQAESEQHGSSDTVVFSMGWVEEQRLDLLIRALDTVFAPDSPRILSVKKRIKDFEINEARLKNTLQQECPCRWCCRQRELRGRREVP